MYLNVYTSVNIKYNSEEITFSSLTIQWQKKVKTITIETNHIPVTQ